jgi:O-antigen/teichoic acid export membrane protein
MTDAVAAEARDLAATSVRGGAANIGAQAAKTVATIGATAALGRLLRPDDFGLAAIALATIGVFGRVKDVGLFTATIQRKDLTDAQASTVFWLSAALSSLLAGLLAALAPAAARLYGDPRLAPVVAVLALTVLVDGLAAQHEALLTRRMRFASLAAVDTAAFAAGVVAALWLAVRGASYWALVGQEVVYSIASACLVFSVCRWRPGAPSRDSGVRPVVELGLYFSGYRLVNYLALNLDTMFVGRFWGARSAGLYDRSYRLLTAPLQLLNLPLGSVAQVTLSRLQDAPDRFRTFYRRGIHLAFAMSMPLMVFLFVDAENAVLTLLGGQWITVVPIYRVLAPAAFLGKFNFVTSWVYVSTGRGDRQLRWGVCALLPLLAAYAVGVRWGAVGVAAAYSIVSCALRYPSIVYCFRTAPVRPRDVLDAARAPALSSLGAGAVLFAAARAVPASWPAAVKLAADGAMYGAVYLACWTALPGGRQIIREVAALARRAARPGSR